MSSAVIPLALAAPAKSPKKRARPQKKKTGPTLSDLIVKSVAASTERKGLSLVSLKKLLQAGGYDVNKNRARIVACLRRLAANKTVVQTKGTGASGSFKLNKKPPKAKKVVKKKPKAKKPRKAVAKKAAAGATPAAKKSPKKKRKAKSPKKAKKPAAAKKPKRSPKKSPKKVKRRVVKSTRTRAAAKK